MSSESKVKPAESQAGAKAAELKSRILDFLKQEQAACVVSAAPGSGKSTLMLDIASQVADAGKTVVIATSTNNQANDLLAKWLKKFKNDLRLVRVARQGLARPKDEEGNEIFPDSMWITKLVDRPPTAKVVVATSASLVFACAKPLHEIPNFDYLFMEEAYQATWSKFMQISALSSRVLMIGDRGQIPPVVSIDAKKWDTSTYPPNWPAPQTLEYIANQPGNNLADRFMKKDLSTSWRIPKESLPVVQAFYDMDLEPVADEGERKLLTTIDAEVVPTEVRDALEAASSGSPVLLQVPLAKGEIPTRADEILCASVADFIQNLFESQPRTIGVKTEITRSEGEEGKAEKGEKAINKATDKVPLTLDDVMVLATKRETLAVLGTKIHKTINDMREAHRDGIADGDIYLKGNIFIDTPERAQGLERRVVLVVHPLSGVSKPTEFDLETGRLSVMASRHQIALFVFSRENVGEVLKKNLPAAAQALGISDKAGEGHRQHLAFWKWFIDQEQTFSLN